MANKLTGKASYVLLNNTQIPITKYSPKVTRTLADSTDSTDYDATIDMINMSQLPVTLSQELSVEGKWNLANTNQALLTMCYSGITAVPVVLGLNAGALFGSGLFDMSDFSADSPINDTITFTCTLRSNGKFTPGS